MTYIEKLAVLYLFQFHTGSIKSGRDRVGAAPGEAQKFQFHTGSIKSIERVRPVAASACVSIPHWFD
jgi:hypothetical protein